MVLSRCYQPRKSVRQILVPRFSSGISEENRCHIAEVIDMIMTYVKMSEDLLAPQRFLWDSLTVFETSELQ